MYWSRGGALAPGAMVPTVVCPIAPRSVHYGVTDGSVGHEDLESTRGRDTVNPGQVLRTEKEWRKLLNPEQLRVRRRKGTKPPFSGNYLNHREEGVFRFTGCGQESFDSKRKYDSGTSWPSFCFDAHLGHGFDEGPPPAGLQYCINCVALEFQSAEDRRAMNNAATEE